MNRRSPDRISMLVDGELQAWEVKEALQDLMQDAEMQSCWRNYHMIGDAMRGHLISPVRFDLSDRVTQALQNEPIYFPPRDSQTSVPGQTRTRSAVGFALAASLSAIAVIGVMQFGTEDVSDGAPVAASAPAAATALALEEGDAGESAPQYLYTFTADVQTLPAAVASAAGSPVTLAADAGQAPHMHTVAAARELPNDLTDYLLNYPHYSANHEQEDTLSYLRLVGYGD